MTVDEITADEMTVVNISVDKIVDKMTIKMTIKWLDKMTVD